MAVVGNRDLCQSDRPREWIEQYVQPKDQIVLKEEVFVLGDCSSVSIDSRVWGPLDVNEIVGKPILRLWPLERFGPVPSLPLPTANTNWNDDE